MLAPTGRLKRPFAIKKPDRNRDFTSSGGNP
jgi:hypothetical protein